MNPPTRTQRSRTRGKPQAEVTAGPSEKRPDSGDLTNPPVHLPSEGKKLWRRIIKELHRLGLVTSIDWELFGAMCQAYADYIEAVKQVNKLTPARKIVVIKGIAPYPHPWIKLKETAEKRYHTLACEFGCSPAARSRIKNRPTTKKGKEALDRFKQGRNGESK